MRLITLIMSFLLSTSIVFAAPGMSNLSPARQEQIKKIKENKERSLKNLLAQIDSKIAQLENKEKKNSVKRQLSKLDEKIGKNLKKIKIDASKTLSDRNKFTLAFNDAKALNPELTQYEFKQNLLKLTNDEYLSKAKERTLQKFKDAKTITNVLRDMKVAIEDNRLDLLTKSSRDLKSRSIASSNLTLEESLVIISVFAVTLTAAILVIALLGAVTLGTALLWSGPIIGVILLIVFTSPDGQF